MTTPSILVAGIGNIFYGDDAFGVEVAQRMGTLSLPAGVRVRDFGIRGLDLAYALTDGSIDATILVDAVPRGCNPGTVYVIEPDLACLDSCNPGVEAHALDPVQVLALAQSLGGIRGRVFLIGCEPAELDAEDGSLELSPAVQAAVPEAIETIKTLIDKLRSGELGVGNRDERTVTCGQTR
jgi:hydrogenase maturation protease